MQHLDYESRVRIQSLLYDQDIPYKQYEIAKKLWVSEGAISNELSWAKKNKVMYNASRAEERHKKKRREANKKVHGRNIIWTELEKYIIKHIKQYWSPEQISHTRNIKAWDNLSHSTVYSYIYQFHPERKKKYMRRKWKKYKHSGRNKTKILNRIPIEKRPKIVEMQERIWDFEWDTIVGENKSDCIITIVERKTNLLLSRVVHLNKWEKLAIVVSTIMTEMIQSIRKELVHTLTLDNWTEFADHEYLSERTWIDIYFANPYHSRERWCNEWVNGLLRQFLPKKTSFKNLTQEELDWYVKLINLRPRKKLNWKSPSDVFFA